MGFIDTTTDPRLAVFYNVVHAVGKNCPNQRDDVKLVQYLLMAFYDKVPSLTQPKGEIAVTGYCGPATMNWIVQFQLDANKLAFGSTALDSRIDRVRDHNVKGSFTKTYYTILTLNKWVIDLNPEAWLMTPLLIPLDNPMNVPPPSWDVVQQQQQNVPESGGF